jgi:hypothetical protein
MRLLHLDLSSRRPAFLDPNSHGRLGRGTLNSYAIATVPLLPPLPKFTLIFEALQYICEINNDLFPVNSAVPFQTFMTAPAFVTFVIGIELSAVSVGVLALEWVGNWSKVEDVAHLHVWLYEERSLMIRFE